MHHPIIDALTKYLVSKEHSFIYFGPKLDQQIDWTKATLEASKSVVNQECDEAIVLCWTGTGASILANKVRGIRAALCLDAETAKGARIYNHANVLALSIRLTSIEILKEILDAWFQTLFSKDSWNLKQIEALRAVETSFLQ